MKPPNSLLLLGFALFQALAQTNAAAALSLTSGTADAPNPIPIRPNLENPNQSTSSPPGTTEVPVQTRPFMFTLPRQHLLGDWAGLLPALADLGITPTLTYVTDIAGNPVGGKRQDASYCDNIGLSLLFDLNKSIGLDGGSLLVTMCQRDGDSLSQKAVGNVFSIQQIYGGQTFHLIDFEYRQKLLNDTVETAVGRLAAGDDFLVCTYDYLFMQNAFDGNPVGIFFNAPGMTAYPNASWGARIKVWPNKRFYVMAGVYNGDPMIRENAYNGANLTFRGPPFFIAEAGYRFNGLPDDQSQYLGDYKIGGWYDDNLYTNYESVGFATPASSRRGNWGVYSLFDQVLLPFDSLKSNRGLGIFGSFLASPDQSVSEMPYFCTAGVVARGIYSARPRDLVGLGFVYGEFSNELGEAQHREEVLLPTSGVQNLEAVLELTYRFSYESGCFFIQPDLQYILHPGGTGRIQDALVLGCQIGVNF